MRLIDADALKKHIDKLPCLPDGNFAGNHSALKALINMQPTVEPQIIRCKVCKFNIEKDDCFCILWNHAVYKDDFCSHAQMMEVDNDV